MNDNMYDDIFRALQSCGFTRNHVEESLSEASYDPYAALDILRNIGPQNHQANNAELEDGHAREDNNSNSSARLEQLLVQRLLSCISRGDVTKRGWLWHKPVIRASRSLGLTREHMTQALALSLPDNCSVLRVLRILSQGQPDHRLRELFCNDFTQELILCIPDDFSTRPGGGWYKDTMKAVMNFGFRMNQVCQAMWHTGFDPNKALRCLVNFQYVHTARRAITHITELSHNRQQTLLIEAAKRRHHM